MEKIAKIKPIKKKHKINKWLTEEPEVNYVRVSRGCSNVYQPKMKSFIRIAELLEVDVRELIIPTK